MFEIDRIPGAVFEALRAEGVDTDTVMVCARADRTREHFPGDQYLLITPEELWVLSGSLSLQTTDVFAGHNTPRPQSVFTVTGMEHYPVSTLTGLRVEELISSGRLIANRKDGEATVFLCAFTNFCKDSMLLFAKYAQKIIDGDRFEIDPRDDPASKVCPKCGMRYPDANRKICPHCMEKGKLFRRFAGFFKKYTKYLIVMLVSLAVLTGMSILAPYLSSGFFFDEVISEEGSYYGRIWFVLGIIIGTRIFRMMASACNNYLTSLIAARVVFDLKKTIFGAIERLSLRFFTGRQTGGLMTQINEDANTIYTFFCDGVPYLIVNVIEIVVLTVLLFLINPLLAFLALLVVPAFVVLMRWTFRKERKLHAQRYSGSSALNGFLADVFSGMRVVKAFSKEDEEIGRFDVRNKRLAKSDRRLAIFTSYCWPVAYQILHLGNIIAWGVGGWMVITGRGNLTYGLLLTFISYIGMVFDPLDFFTQFIDWTADCTNALQRLFEIMDAEPDVSEKEDALDPEDLGGEVVFDHVGFSYLKGRTIIDDVSFDVPDGNILGIVGHTGAGKSTLVNLLMRLYDTDEGEIRIGGYPVRDLKLSAIYRHVAIVSQETYLFMGTILENIRYARPDASFADVVEASKCAGAHDFIMKLPDAYHTRIGFGYQELSGGERQRISIARAILKDPKILILDEATAAMDTGTERKIQEALSMLVKGKTTVMIAHRLSTLRDANELIVIERGKVAERGTHAELLQKEDGIYKKLFTLQEEALKSAGISE